MRTEYERDIYLLLSLYRFFAYGLAAVLIEVVPKEGAELGLDTYLLLATVGAYTLVKVLGPLRWWQADPMTYVVLGGDLVVSLLALLWTGGLTSGFLLYSFLPVITAALLFEERLAIFTAAFSAATLAFAHLVLYRWTDRFAWVMDENFLLWLIFYAIASFLIAASVYRTNLNIRQRIHLGAVLEERRRMRREIHDGVAQALSYLSMKADSVSKMVSDGRLPQAVTGMDDVRKAVGEAYKSIRESLDQLSVEAGAIPLTAALEEYLKQFGERTGIQAHLDVQGPLPRLSPVAELQIMRITQEALSNASKHSEATTVWVTLMSNAKGVEMSIKDNGKGFAPSGEGVAVESQGHHGLGVMRERAEGLGGKLTVQSTPGEGTEVLVSLPRELSKGVLWSR